MIPKQTILIMAIWYLLMYRKSIERQKIEKSLNIYNQLLNMLFIYPSILITCITTLMKPYSETEIRQILTLVDLIMT